MNRGLARVELIIQGHFGIPVARPLTVCRETMLSSHGRHSQQGRLFAGGDHAGGEAGVSFADVHALAFVRFFEFKNGLPVWSGGGKGSKPVVCELDRAEKNTHRTGADRWWGQVGRAGLLSRGLCGADGKQFATEAEGLAVSKCGQSLSVVSKDRGTTSRRRDIGNAAIAQRYFCSRHDEAHIVEAGIPGYIRNAGERSAGCGVHGRRSGWWFV